MILAFKIDKKPRHYGRGNHTLKKTTLILSKGMAF